jgi:hypothetical protein
MQKLISLLRIIYFSFFSKAFYKDVYHNLHGRQIGCLIRIVALVSIIISSVEGYKMWTFLSNLAVDQVINRLPLMSIKDNKLQVIGKTDDKAIFIRNDDGKILIIIDDQAKDNKYQSEKAMIVVVNNGVFLNDFYKFKFSSLFHDQDINLTHDFIEQYWKKLLDMMKFTLAFFIFILIFIELTIQAILYSVFFSVTVLLLHKIIKKQEIKFDSLFRLGVFASLPAMIFSFFLPASLVDFIAFCYLIFAYYNVIYDSPSRI